MSAAQPRAAVISIESRRSAPRRLVPRRAIKLAAASIVCLLGLIGGIADSVVAQSNPDSVVTGLIGAILGNLAAGAGAVFLLYWYLSQPTAEIVELRPRRLTKR
ncbi:MAG TPA: hypothetical protein VGL83_06020 [Stellaceae bacterium]|jgi:uncharacterized membrane-anchored protein